MTQNSRHGHFKKQPSQFLNTIQKSEAGNGRFHWEIIEKYHVNTMYSLATWTILLERGPVKVPVFQKAIPLVPQWKMMVLFVQNVISTAKTHEFMQQTCEYKKMNV